MRKLKVLAPLFLASLVLTPFAAKAASLENVPGVYWASKPNDCMAKGKVVVTLIDHHLVVRDEKRVLYEFEKIDQGVFPYERAKARFQNCQIGEIRNSTAPFFSIYHDLLVSEAEYVEYFGACGSTGSNAYIKRIRMNMNDDLLWFATVLSQKSEGRTYDGQPHYCSFKKQL